MALIIHLGGPRHGDVVDLPETELGRPLVYTGPRWLGVYRPGQPITVQPTASGDAQVWVFVD